MAKSSQETSTRTLPEHLIFDQILPRLPVKSLMRFKSVSKPWLSTIFTPQFAKAHLNLSPTPHQFLLLIDTPFSFMLLPFDDMSKSKTLQTPITMDIRLDSRLRYQLSKSEVELVGSCNGLVCFSGMCPTDVRFFLICNPALPQHRQMTFPNPKYDTCAYWFGYVPSIHDYNIAALFRLYHRKTCEHFYVFSLRTGEWKRFRHLDDYFTDSETLSHETKLVNDVLYWSLQIIKPWDVHHRIIGFDLVDEQLRVFPWMDWLSEYNSAEFFLRDGCLSLLCHRLSDYVKDVWTMRSCDDWSSWKRLFSVHLPFMNICNITPTGKFLVEKYSMRPRLVPNQFMLIDPSQDTENQTQGDAFSCPSEANFWTAIGYVQSLASPFGTTESAFEEILEECFGLRRLFLEEVSHEEEEGKGRQCSRN